MYAKYAKYDLVSCDLYTPPAQNIGTVVMYHSSVSLCIDFQKKKSLAEPYAIHPELKGSHVTKNAKYTADYMQNM